MAYTTRKSLLARVRNGDQISWTEFYNTYKPLILAQGFRCGLNADEKEELLQLVMCEVFQKNIIGKYDPDNIPEHIEFQYDPEKGRFRHFLRKIAYYQALGICRKRRSDLSMDDENISLPIRSEDMWNAVWDEEWYKHILNMALVELKGRIEPKTFAAFEMYALQNRPVEQVASFLDLSVSSVYTAKSRCVSALKTIVKELEEK